MNARQNINPRTARTPSAGEKQYVIAEGAPNHYVSGHGLVSGGAIVTLPPGVTPGRWMVEVAPSDAAKAQSDPTEAQRLAVLAAAKIKAGKNADDVANKEAADEIARRQAAEEAEAKAKAEAEALAKAKAEEEEAARKAADEAAKAAAGKAGK